MQFLDILAGLDPLEAARESFRHNETPMAMGGTSLGAWFYGVNWAAIGAFIGLVVAPLCGVAIHFREQWILSSLRIDAAKRKAELELEAVKTPPEPVPPTLVPDRGPDHPGLYRVA